MVEGPLLSPVAAWTAAAIGAWTVARPAVCAVAALASEDEVRDRCAAVVAERARLTAALRERGLDVADSQANFVWLPLGEQAGSLAAGLEARAVITRPFAGEGVRVSIGAPEENDAFLAALDAVRGRQPDDAPLR